MQNLNIATIQSNLFWEDIIKLVDFLPAASKEVFWLYAIEGYSHKEISELLGIAENTSKSQLSRARSLLQKQIAPNSIKVNRNVVTVYTPGECCFSSYREKLTKNKIIATLKPLNTLLSNQDFSLSVTINGSHVGKVKAGDYEKASFLDFHLKEIFLEAFNELGLDDELIERIDTKTVSGNEFVTIEVNTN